MNTEFIALFVLSAFIKLFASSLLFSLFYMVYKPSLCERQLTGARHLCSTTRNASIFILSFGFMSIVAPLLSTFLLLLPTFSDIIIFEHCHDKACGPHQPSAASFSFLGMLLVSAAATALVIMMAFILRQIAYEISKAKRSLKVLSQLASSEKPLANGNCFLAKDKIFVGANSYSVIESKDVFAWCTGLLKPKIFVSSGMLERVNKKQLRVVLAHEFCHLKQRDNLRKLMIHCCTLFWLPSQKKHIRCDFSQAIERYSEDYAKYYLGSGEHREKRTLIIYGFIHSVIQSLVLITWVALITSASHFFIETQ